ncbi:uncharacterized protein LOC144227814 [Crocuta crocuta]
MPSSSDMQNFPPTKNQMLGEVPRPQIRWGQAAINTTRVHLGIVATSGPQSPLASPHLHPFTGRRCSAGSFSLAATVSPGAGATSSGRQHHRFSGPMSLVPLPLHPAPGPPPQALLLVHQPLPPWMVPGALSGTRAPSLKSGPQPELKNSLSKPRVLEK